MRWRLSPTADVPSHTSGAAMGPLADSCGRMASMAAPSCALAWFRLSPEVLLIRDRRNVQFASLFMGQKATLVSTPTRGPSTLERRPQSRIERAWPRRAERTRIYEFRAAIGEIGQGAARSQRIRRLIRLLDVSPNGRWGGISCTGFLVPRNTPKSLDGLSATR
jgi:hypothetical protein